jgi:DNA-binding CsgD family transcriptional regulator
MITLNVNGKPTEIDSPNDMPLLWTLRDVLSMTGTKFGSGIGLCGARFTSMDGSSCRISVDAGASQWCKGAVGMNSSFGLALPAKSLPGSLSATSYESEIALGNNVKQSEKTQLSSVRLSARERTIVLLMGHGLSNKRIARQLSIAPETVKSHTKRIFWKLMVQSRAQAVYRASTLGFI